MTEQRYDTQMCGDWPLTAKDEAGWRLFLKGLGLDPSQVHRTSCSLCGRAIGYVRDGAPTKLCHGCWGESVEAALTVDGVKQYDVEVFGPGPLVEGKRPSGFTLRRVDAEAQ